MAEEADAFDGVRVVELAQWVFVPVAGALLADWGAEVIRVDRPEGDPYRGLVTQGIGAGGGGVNLSVALANRGHARQSCAAFASARNDLSGGAGSSGDVRDGGTSPPLQLTDR